MTSEEAKTKWCPMARVATTIHDWDNAESGIGGAACNRGNDNDMTDTAKCLGSDCAVWMETDNEGSGCGLVASAVPLKIYQRGG